MGDYDNNIFTSYNCAGGQICKANTIVPDLCPPGKYADPAYNTKPMETEYCLNCKVGFYCPDWGIKESDLTNAGGVYS